MKSYVMQNLDKKERFCKVYNYIASKKYYERKGQMSLFLENFEVITIIKLKELEQKSKEILWLDIIKDENIKNKFYVILKGIDGYLGVSLETSKELNSIYEYIKLRQIKKEETFEEFENNSNYFMKDKEIKDLITKGIDETLLIFSKKTLKLKERYNTILEIYKFMDRFSGNKFKRFEKEDKDYIKKQFKEEFGKFFKEYKKKYSNLLEEGLSTEFLEMNISNLNINEKELLEKSAEKFKPIFK